MMYNVYNLEASKKIYVINSSTDLVLIFKKFLQAEKISSGSTRSYLSDVRHFFAWLTLFLKSNRILSNTFPSFPSLDALNFLNSKIIGSYKNYLLTNNIPITTINRRFSALRKFGAFCQSQLLLQENYFDTLKTILENKPFPEERFHLGEFRTQLWKNNATKSTIKNYLADIKQFVVWLEKNSLFD